MSVADDRQQAIEKEVETIRDVYRMNSAPEIITLFADLCKVGTFFTNKINTVIFSHNKS